MSYAEETQKFAEEIMQELPGLYQRFAVEECGPSIPMRGDAGYENHLVLFGVYAKGYLAARREPTEKQYRAVVGRPWCILDRNLPEDQPVFEWTGPLPRKDPKLTGYLLQRSEETHAWLERWEERDIFAGDWRDSE